MLIDEISVIKLEIIMCYSNIVNSQFCQFTTGKSNNLSQLLLLLNKLITEFCQIRGHVA